MRYELKRIKENMYIKLAWLLPRKLTMWCAIRVITHATTGEYENTIVPELSAMDALKRWDTNDR